MCLYLLNDDWKQLLAYFIPVMLNVHYDTQKTIPAIANYYDGNKNWAGTGGVVTVQPEC